MRTHPDSFAAIIAGLAILSLPLTLSRPAGAQGVDPALFGGLQWREIGPFRGGRCTAVSGVPGRPQVFFMGATGGGLWRTTDGGASWRNVSDGFFGTGSVGGIGVSASNPDVLYVGMGETEIRGDISHGDGVYKSTDGGDTWTHAGLRDTRFIARVRVHPTNPDVVWLAALGHVYGPSPERGVFKTTDGGATWKKVLYVDERSGAIDLTLEPGHPDVLYAATWEAWRTPWQLNSGGPGSRLFKSTDGGSTWQELSRNPGLPKGILGKMGVAVSPADPQRVWAIVEAEAGGIFRSDDAGATWTLLNDDRRFRQRAWYYTRIYADPKDRQKVYVLNTGFYRSTDGGTNFTSLSVPHGDNHDLWISPDNPEAMINSNDGGANVTFDGGRTWSDQDFATAQFYHVTTDNAFPYRILGAQQDNATARIVSRTTGRGITNADWTDTAGGESGYIAVKPDDPDIVFGGSYGGLLTRLDHGTGLDRDVNPWPDNPMGHGAIDAKFRFQWTYPILFSPNDPDLLYVCTQFVLKSTNEGETWKVISPDLTRADPRTLQESGGPITKDDTSVEYYATVFTLAESPRRPGLLWAGSDDGLVHVSRDAGGSWERITPAGMPEWGLCSMIEASPHNEGTAYLAVDNHENDDYTPWIFITHDFGASWEKKVEGIPITTFVRAVREDPAQKGLLYAATEMGVSVSFDDGERWQSLQLNLPVVPVHDLAVKEDDLIAATHGRSFWVLDDVCPLRQLAAGEVSTSAPYFFPPKDAWAVRWGGGFGGGGGRRGAASPATPVGANPPSGVVLDYYLPRDVERVRLTFTDPAGREFMTMESGERGAPAGLSGQAGMHRTSAFLQYPSFRGFEGMIFWAAGASPITAAPGTYTVTLAAGGFTQSRSFRWKGDPRSGSSDDDLVAQFEFSMRVRDRANDANDTVVKIRDIKSKLDAAVAEDSRLRRDAETIKTKLSAVEAEIYQVKNRSGQDPLNYPIKLNNKIAALLGVVQSGPYRPTDQSYEVFAGLSAQLQVQLDAYRGVVEKELAAFNERLRRAGKEPIVPIDPAAGPGR
jgi:photosystem II stability/assembly factor-like uncharacterized protein